MADGSRTELSCQRKQQRAVATARAQHDVANSSALEFFGN